MTIEALALLLAFFNSATPSGDAAATPSSVPESTPTPVPASTPASAPTRAPAPDPGGAIAYFTGTWLCGKVTWSFTPLEPGSPWLRVNYRNASESFGTAIFGYVPRLGVYVYRDFHADGGYANLTAKPPAGDKKWVFTGPFYEIDGSAPLNGYITYTIKSATQYDRTLESVTNGVHQPEGDDTCIKQ